MTNDEGQRTSSIAFFALTGPAAWGTSGRRSADGSPARHPGVKEDADTEKEFQVVKHTLACVAGALALFGGYAVWGGWAAAQQPGNPVRQTSATGPAPATPMTASAMPGTRVAVVNINKVLKNYNKAQSLNAAIRSKVQGYAKVINEKKEAIQKAQAELAKPTTTQQQKEEYEKQIVNLQRSLQDLDNEARKSIGKEQGDIAVQIFKEIELVIKAVATSNNFDIVLSYPDATDEAEMYTQENVVRKLATQAAMPLFYKPHVDMTNAVIQTLNTSYPVAWRRTPSSRHRHADRFNTRARDGPSRGSATSRVPCPRKPWAWDPNSLDHLTKRRRPRGRDREPPFAPSAAHARPSSRGSWHRFPDRRRRPPAFRSRPARHRDRLRSHRHSAAGAASRPPSIVSRGPAGGRRWVTPRPKSRSWSTSWPPSPASKSTTARSN